MIAAKRGYKNIVEALLHFGAEIKDYDFLERGVKDLSDKFVKDVNERQEIMELIKMKQNGEFVPDLFKYRDQNFLDSLKIDSNEGKREK